MRACACVLDFFDLLCTPLSNQIKVLENGVKESRYNYGLDREPRYNISIGFRIPLKPVTYTDVKQ